MSLWRPALIKLTKVASIASISRDGTYVTYTTSSIHNFSTGEIITITGASSTAFNLSNVSIYDTPTVTTFRVASAVIGTTSTATGTITYILSDHNRGDVQVSNEIIEKSKRMANGLMRKYVVANKKKYTVSWSMLPSTTAQTIDGYLGAIPLLNMFETNYDNTMTLSFYAGNATTPTQAKGSNPAATMTKTVFITDFSSTIKKRLGDVDYWDANIEFTEA